MTYISCGPFVYRHSMGFHFSYSKYSISFKTLSLSSAPPSVWAASVSAVFLLTFLLACCFVTGLSAACLPACLPAFLPVRISSSKLMSFRPFHLPFLVSLKTTLCSSSYHNTCAVMVYIPLCNRSLCQCGISECSVIAVMLSASSVYTNWASSVFMAVAVNNAVVWDVTPCSVIELCQRCGRACCASFQDRM